MKNNLSLWKEAEFKYLPIYSSKTTIEQISKIISTRLAFGMERIGVRIDGIYARTSVYGFSRKLSSNEQSNFYLEPVA